MEQQIELLLQGSQFKQLMEHRIIQLREQYNLRKVDIEILYYLSYCGGKDTSKDMREQIKLTKGHISQSIDRMQKMNLLVYIPDEADRRCVHIRLTPQADQVVKEIKQVWWEMYHIVFEGVTEEEKRVLAEVALKMGKNMEKALQK